MSFNKDILNRYFTGKYSKKDFNHLKSYFEERQYRNELKDYLERHWLEYNKNPLVEGEIDHVLHKIQHQIRLSENFSNSLSLMEIFKRIAAILIVPMMLTFLAVLYFQNEKQETQKALVEIQCPLGVRTKFELPDGTTGFLNSGSKLKYTTAFSEKRNLKLSGEAFFDVIQMNDKPFTVSTSNLEIEVLGTEFNVIAYDDEDIEEVVLQKGEVEVFSLHSAKKLINLKPDEKLQLNSVSRTFNKTRVESSQYVGWTEGKLIFRNECMKQVAMRLGRWYNADIEIMDDELLNYAFHATFIDEPLDEVLRLMAYTTPVKYKMLERESTKENIYKKRKVLLWLDRNRVDSF